MKSQESLNHYDLMPFLKELEPDSRVLVLKREEIEVAGKDGSILERLGHSVSYSDQIQKNLLFLSLKENEFGGVWANQVFNLYRPEEVQRLVATCFRGLQTGGVLGVIVEEGEGSYEDRGADLSGSPRTVFLYREKQLCSMLDQTGFKIITVGHQKADDQEKTPARLLVLTTRI